MAQQNHQFILADYTNLRISHEANPCEVSAGTVHQIQTLGGYQCLVSLNMAAVPSDYIADARLELFTQETGRKVTQHYIVSDHANNTYCNIDVIRHIKNSNSDVPFTVVDYMNLTNTRDLGNLAGNTIHKFTTPTNEEGFVKFVSAGIPYSGNNIIAANGPNDYNNYNLQHYELVSGGVCQCDFDVEFTY